MSQSLLLPELLQLRSHESLLDVTDPRVDVEEEALATIRAGLVRRFVRALPQPERAVIGARFGVGSHRRARCEVARELGVDVSAVQRLERRALERLRRLDAVGKAGAPATGGRRQANLLRVGEGC